MEHTRKLTPTLKVGSLSLLALVCAASLYGNNAQANTSQTDCRPDGLYQTPGITVPYCTIYDAEGRELMGADHPRRVIGYFTSWRSGSDPQAAT